MRPSSLPFFIFALLALLGGSVSAVKIRVASYNVLTGIGDSTDPGRIALEQVLNRIGADVIGFQEVVTSDFANGNLTDLAAALGYPHVFIPTTALDANSRVVIISRFPFVQNSPTSIISPPGANDMTRAAAAVTIDVPGTNNDLLVVNAHLKCCFDLDDPFRRAVEMNRIRDYLASQSINGTQNAIVLGDFNLLGGDFSYSIQPEGLPPSYQLGNDVQFPVLYYANPVTYFSGQGMVNPGYRHQDGIGTSTFIRSGTVLDHLLVSNAIASRNPATEIFNASLDFDFPGLPKFGPPLNSSITDPASDHYLIFGDFELDGGPALGLSISPNLILENSPPATLTVTLPAPAASPITVFLQNSAPAEASLGATSLVIPAGQTQTTVTITPKLDRVTDGDQSLQILASAADYQGGLANLVVRDADPLFYQFTDQTTPIIEDFTHFQGSQNPAAWPSSLTSWRGPDDGSQSSEGGRSYQESLGIATTTPVTFSVTIKNNSPFTIAAASLSYTAQQWRRLNGGSADRWELSYLLRGQEIPIPKLTFVADTDGPSATLSPPLSQTSLAYLRNLALIPGQEMQVLFRAVPGTSGQVVSDAIFINEFHYDNQGADVGEFVEIVVGPGFASDLNKVALYLYNGNNGLVYGTHPLETFTESSPAGPDGFRFFTKMIPGIQNGAPDGFALVDDSQVVEFLSYEGTFTAADGPASGMTSVPIAVSQAGTSPIGTNSIARTGTGVFAQDFFWTIQPGPHTPGQTNSGQSFQITGQPQGIALDDFTLTPLLDSDSDGLPDPEELALDTHPLNPDSDHDGQSDFFEVVLAGTNPLDPTSFFKPSLHTSSDHIQLTFPTRLDRKYQIQSSADLESWHIEETIQGTGAIFQFDKGRILRDFLRIEIFEF